MHSKEVKSLNAYTLGLLPYDKGLLAQAFFHKLVCKGLENPCLLLMEHTPVITFGKRANTGFLKSSCATLRSSGIDLFETDRGGQLTAHAPGQLVVYPIIPLASFGLGVKAYVHLLEQTVINLLRCWGVRSQRDPEHPGVWYGNSKVCAVGIRVKNRVSMHGLALNVNADLDIFSHIVPCGIEGRSVVNLESLVDAKLQLRDVAKRFVYELGKLLQVEVDFKPHGSLPKNMVVNTDFFAHREG